MSEVAGEADLVAFRQSQACCSPVSGLIFTVQTWEWCRPSPLNSARKGRSLLPQNLVYELTHYRMNKWTHSKHFPSSSVWLSCSALRAGRLTSRWTLSAGWRTQQRTEAGWPASRLCVTPNRRPKNTPASPLSKYWSYNTWLLVSCSSDSLHGLKFILLMQSKLL